MSGSRFSRVVSRRFCLAASGMLVAAMAFAEPETARAQSVVSGLIPETVALRHGLHRSWVSQVHLDLARDRLTHVTLDRNVICIQTRNGLTQVVEAETGGTRWIAQIGKTGAPSSELAANERYVAATNGTSLFVLDVATGRPFFQQQLDGVPFAAPAVDDTRVYVPLFSGMIISYSLVDPRSQPWLYQSTGRILAQPIVTPRSVAWGTSRGYAYISDRNRVNVRFQLQTQGEIVSPLAHRAGVIYVASRDGYAYAVSEDNGQMLWRFSAGSALSHEPVIVEDMLFLFPEEGGMFAVSADRGTELWRRGNVKQFLAFRRADPKHPDLAPCLYAADRAGRTLMLDPATGGLMDTMPTEMLTLKMTNTLNDRLYLATPMGVIQCLHHPELTEPLWLNTEPEPADAKPKAPAGGNVEEEPAAMPDEAEVDPFDDVLDPEGN